jgi:hypothetical protein
MTDEEIDREAHALLDAVAHGQADTTVEAAANFLKSFAARVRSEAVEEAAKVAEDEWAHTSGYGTPDFNAYQKACSRVAKAIRRLAPRSQDEKEG